MINRDWERGQITKKYDEHLRTASGGIFDPRARKRLLGQARPYGGRYAQNTRANFWNRIKEDVTNALVDLALFIEAAPSEKVNQVISYDAVKPIIDAYFQLEYGPNAEKSIVKAEMAHEMVNAGFYYLRVNQYGDIHNFENEIVDKALDVSKVLAERMELTIMKKEQETSK